MAAWRPKLSQSHSVPIYRQLVAAIATDIETGKLAPGERLTPQRDLAHTLSISVGSVTRAYDDAARRGLVLAHVGRGTFVIDRRRESATPDGLIDLSINTAPIVPVDAAVEAIGALYRTKTWAERLSYQPTPGLEADRRAGASWLAQTAGFADLDWRRIILCAGAQNAMAVAFAALCRPGDTILCEAMTFSGAKSLALQQGYKLHPVDMDAEGLKPQSLDRAAAATGARAIYLLPTLQNPTTRTMGPRRRADIVKIARARDLWIVEDDVYAPYGRHLDLPPLASLVPERALYVSSLSKILSPGLRIGYLVAPAGEILDRCLRAARALVHSPAGPSAAIATDWIESGRAGDLARDIRAEVGTRTAAALSCLKGLVEEPRTAMSLHVWLPMAAAEADRALARALASGVRLPSPEAFSVGEGRGPSGLRLCLGSVPDHATLTRALGIVKTALTGKEVDREQALL